MRLRRKSIAFTLLAYWIILVVWQNVNSVGAKSVADMIVKTGLLIYLVSAFFFGSNNKMRNPLLIAAFFISLLISYLGEEELNINITVSYAFMFTSVFCVYGIGDMFTIQKTDFILFLRGVIIVGLYCAFYAMIFSTSQFLNAFRVSNAYGNELSSFFSSSHEYGLYMSSGIISSYICLELDQDKTWRKLYIPAMIIFIPNLILTFSRTTIFGTAVYFLCFMFLTHKGKTKRAVVIIALFGTLLFFTNPQINYYLTKVVFKNNLIGSRENLYHLAIEMLKNANLKERILGYGIYQTRSIFETHTRYGSVHNAYLQIMLYYGLIGILWLIIMIFKQLSIISRVRKRNNYIFSISISLLFWAISMMLTNTFIVFTSSVDCFFMTIFSIIIPKYLINSLKDQEITD